MLKQQIRKLLLEDTPEKDIKLWFDPLLFSHVEDNRLKVEFPHQLFYDWFKTRFKKRFEDKLCLLQNGCVPVYIGKDISSTFKGEKTKPENIDTEANNIKTFAAFGSHEYDARRHSNQEYGERTHSLSQFVRPNITNGYCFDNFLHNRKNQFPLAAAKDFSRLAGPSPFTVHSENGCGKTHLLCAIYEEIKTIVPENSIFFCKLGELETIIENNEKQGNTFFYPFFEKKVLLIDNFQDCSGSIETQKNMVMLLELCLEQKIPFAASVDTPPAKWSFMEKRLRSILESGLIIEIKKPDLEIKIRYIQEKSNELNLKLKKDEILQLARMYNEFRQIQGALLKILSFSEHLPENEKKLDLSNILNNSRAEAGSLLNPKLVLNCVAEVMQLTPEQITGKGRERKTALARHMVMYLLREMLAVPLTVIGKFMGKDHSSVLYSINKIHELNKTNKEMNKTVANLKQMCLNKAGQI